MAKIFTRSGEIQHLNYLYSFYFYLYNEDKDGDDIPLLEHESYVTTEIEVDDVLDYRSEVGYIDLPDDVLIEGILTRKLLYHDIVRVQSHDISGHIVDLVTIKAKTRNRPVDARYGHSLYDGRIVRPGFFIVRGEFTVIRSLQEEYSLDTPIDLLPF